MAFYEKIFENNVAWVDEMKTKDPEFFVKLSREQKPDILFIGCADSRVPANQIMGLEPGQVFVHRNIANLVVNTDLNAHSVIEYAVNHLEVKEIVVCGHYGCGGVNAAMQSKDLGVLNGWLREIRDVFRTHKRELLEIEDVPTRFRRLVQLNVQEQCLAVIKTASVQKRFREFGFPRVHGWAYDLGTGLIEDLEIPFEEILAGIREIYALD